ncbi:Outer membrane protein assembly factor BamB precursor [Aureliella helgolandensis]|uniref:Outer membrane protein assembly factor BamB n=2 Tax=Aureliella helgolandensis TaxID=2527968 RepID=A0A518G8P9_9BACT|nr:Outer membrane protein assembly factor BamB precursor [Aureliella helgolandensis]
MACLSLMCIVSARAADWPMGRGNVAGTGATDEPLPDSLELLWEVELKGLGFDAGPIIAGGVVYAADHDGRIFALQLATGKELWRRELETGFVASPAIDGDTLYVGDYEGNLHALDAQTGKEKWVFTAGLEIDASPNFYGDLVLLTSQDGILYGLSKANGQLKWKYETGDQLQCGPTLAGKQTFLGGCDANLHVIDVETGQVTGEPIPIDAPTGSTPSVLDLDSRDAAGNPQQLVLVPTYAGEIFAFPAGQRTPRWRFKDEKLADEFKNSVAVAEGLIVATSRNKRVFALSADSGKVKWTAVLRKRSDASPVIAGQSVVVAAADGRILRYDLRTGKELWMFEVKGSFIGSPAVADGRLVVANDRGTLFCFGEKKK